jgi:hypothetical protein
MGAPLIAAPYDFGGLYWFLPAEPVTDRFDGCQRRRDAVATVTAGSATRIVADDAAKMTSG